MHVGTAYHLPHVEFLGETADLNEFLFGSDRNSLAEERGIVAELAPSNRVAQWAYGQTEAPHGLTWLRAGEMVPLDAGWRRLLA